MLTYFLIFVALFGLLLILYLMFAKPTKDKNQYGNNLRNANSKEIKNTQQETERKPQLSNIGVQTSKFEAENAVKQTTVTTTQTTIPASENTAATKAPEVAFTLEQMRHFSPAKLKQFSSAYKDFKPFANLVVTVQNIQLAAPASPVDKNGKIKQPHYFTEKVVAETGKEQDGKIYLNLTEAYMCAAIAGQLVNSKGELVTRGEFVALFNAGSEEVLEIKALGFSANKCLVELQGQRYGLKIEA